jgi:hypothetical protein
MKANTVEWVTGDTFNLKAPILNFTIQEILDSDFRAHVAEVLKFWIDYDVENSRSHQERHPVFLGTRRLRDEYNQVHWLDTPGWTLPRGIVTVGPKSPERATRAYRNTLLSEE